MTSFFKYGDETETEVRVDMERVEAIEFNRESDLVYLLMYSQRCITVSLKSWQAYQEAQTNNVVRGLNELLSLS